MPMPQAPRNNNKPATCDLVLFHHGSSVEAANNRIRVREAYAGTKVDEAFARFDTLERRVDLAEGRADALGLGAQPKSLEEEIAELRTSEKVEAELEALKAAVKKG